jgi:predicted transposase YbfD/YdcC
MRSSSKIAVHFESLEDPRVVGRTDHPLLTVIVMAVVAVIGGAEGWEEIADFAEDRQEWFAKFLDMPNGVPSESTFYRVFRAIRPAAFEACMRSWIDSLAASLAGEVVAFDGKALRGAMARAALGAKLHLVHVWATRQRLLLAQKAVEGAPEEIGAVRDLLELIDVEGAVVTGDAAHCNRETAQTIVDRKADWLLKLKANRAAAYERALAFFSDARAQAFEGHTVRHHRVEESGHGRHEIREGWTFPASACSLPGEDWPSLKSVTFIESTRVVGTEASRELHIYLGSLPPTVRRIMASAREHWQIENGLHWRLDVEMGEDRCKVHEANAATNLASMRRLALMLLQRDETCRRGKRIRGIAAKRAKAGRNTEYLEHVLTLGTK